MPADQAQPATAQAQSTSDGAPQGQTPKAATAQATRRTNTLPAMWARPGVIRAEDTSEESEDEDPPSSSDSRPQRARSSSSSSNSSSSAEQRHRKRGKKAPRSWKAQRKERSTSPPRGELEDGSSSDEGRTLAEALRAGDGTKATRALPYQWAKYNFRELVERTADRVEKGSVRVPTFMTEDWLHRLMLLQLRYEHLKVSLKNKKKAEDPSAWLLGEELMVLLWQMQFTRCSPTEIHQALYEAKAAQKAKYLFASRDREKQKRCWSRVEEDVVQALRKRTERWAAKPRFAESSKKKNFPAPKNEQRNGGGKYAPRK